MGERVIADLMTLGVRLPEQGEMRFGVLTDDEKRPRRSSRSKRVENRGCPGAVRPVVESESDAMRTVAGALNDVRYRKLQIALVADHSRRGVEDDLPDADLRAMLDAENLSRAVELHVVSAGNGVDRRRGSHRRPSSECAPE